MTQEQSYTKSEQDKVEHDQVEENEAQPLDKKSLYGDTVRSSEYTSEDHKLELLNLPAKTRFHTLKSALEKQFKVQAHKIRVGYKRAYLAFRTEEERDDAIEKLNDKVWKGKSLSAQLATPRDDTLAKKRKLYTDDSANIVDATEQIEPSADDINNQVCPLWSRDYDDQIQYKDALMRKALKMSRDVLKMSRNLREESPKLYEWAMANKNICCPFEGVERSPVLTGYRNKCEFNVGRTGIVGFKMGRYVGGSERVCRPPDNCPILTKTMFIIIDHFHDYLTKVATLKPYDLVTHEGNYRQLTVRCNSNDEFLLIVDLHPQRLTDDDIEKEIQLLISHFKTLSQVISIYFNISAVSQFASSTQSLRFVFGQDCLYEYLSIEPESPLKFRIGPGSFFQVNSRAAELLYRSIIDVADLNLKTMVLDVGCGTGTIGLSLAKRVNHVIGIELVPNAIEDAKMNATTNGIGNVTYFAGRAEDLLSESISILRKKLEYQKIDDGEIVAIVDPPRVGFKSSFVKTLRASSIKKIIYIACDANANPNLLALCRPKSKAYIGQPFVPKKAKAFDLFPHTRCCELMIVYERLTAI